VRYCSAEGLQPWARRRRFGNFSGELGGVLLRKAKIATLWNNDFIFFASILKFHTKVLLAARRRISAKLIPNKDVALPAPELLRNRPCDINTVFS
jgi:hypothetical protein